jgi:hypothetical protein
MDRLALLIRAWDESESGTWSCYIGRLLGSIQHGIQAPNSTSLKCPRLTGSMSTRSSSLPTPTRRGMPPCAPGPVVWLPYPLILWPGFPISTSMWSRTLWCHVSPDRGRASTPPCVHGRVGRLLHLCPPTGWASVLSCVLKLKAGSCAAPCLRTRGLAPPSLSSYKVGSCVAMCPRICGLAALPSSPCGAGSCTTMCLWTCDWLSCCHVSSDPWAGFSCWNRR